MPGEERYRVDYATDVAPNLKEVLQYVATLKGHVRIVSVTWQPEGKDREGHTRSARYTIISEAAQG